MNQMKYDRTNLKSHLANSRIIVSCSGPAQVINAIAALSQCLDIPTTDAARRIDHWIIQDLAEQSYSALIAWIKCFSSPETSILPWQDDLQSSEVFSPSNRPTVLLMPRDWSPSNKALMAQFKDACFICFGDGPGCYSHPFTFRPEYPPENIFARLKMGKIFHSNFAYGIFNCVEGLGNFPSFQWQNQNHQLVSELWNLSTEFDLPNCTSIDASLPKPFPEKWNLVLTSPFSENTRLSVGNEVECWVAWLSASAAAKTTWIFKPHPREDLTKVQAIAARLESASNCPCFVLANRGFADFPIEYLLLKLSRNGFATPENVFGASSALISLKMLMPINVVSGFGEALVEKFWHRWFVKNRNWHEHNLNAILNRLP